MYEIDDFIVYSNIGVCKVMDITYHSFLSADSKELYYVLKPLYQDGVIYIPINSPVFMRSVITKEEANKLIDSMPDLEVNSYNNSNIKFLSETYKKIIKTHNCKDLAVLSKSIYQKRNALKDEKNRKLGQTDEKYMKQAETLLFGELAVALGIDINDVPKYIQERLA